MTSANPNLPRPPSYYFKPIKVEPEPAKQATLNDSHETPDLFEPPAKRNFRRPTPFPTTSTASTIPPTPYIQKPMLNRWLLDPMP